MGACAPARRGASRPVSIAPHGPVIPAKAGTYRMSARPRGNLVFTSPMDRERPPPATPACYTLAYHAGGRRNEFRKR